MQPINSSPYFLEDRGKNGSGITVLGRVLAVKPAELFQARQLQGVHVRRMVLGQMFVSLQLIQGHKAKTSEPQCKDYPHFQYGESANTAHLPEL